MEMNNVESVLLSGTFNFFLIKYLLFLILQRQWFNNGVCRRRCGSTWKTFPSDTQFRRCLTLLLLVTL